VVWLEELLRPPPSLLFLPLLPPSSPLLWFLLLFLFLFWLPPLAPLGGRDGVEDSALAAGGGQRWCRVPSGQPKDPYYPCGSRPEL
jgi:hypothetical protein